MSPVHILSLEERRHMGSPDHNVFCFHCTENTLVTAHGRCLWCQNRFGSKPEPAPVQLDLLGAVA